MMFFPRCHFWGTKKPLRERRHVAQNFEESGGLRASKLVNIYNSWQKYEKPKWLITAPEKALANDAIVTYLTDLLFNSKSFRTLSVKINTIKEFGLE